MWNRAVMEAEFAEVLRGWKRSWTPWRWKEVMRDFRGNENAFYCNAAIAMPPSAKRIHHAAISFKSISMTT